MFARLSDQIIACHEEATLARLRAVSAPTPKMQREYRRLEQHWLRLAASLDFAAHISGFLQWTSRRLEPPPR